MILTISHLSGHPFICYVFVSRSHVCKISLETRTFLWHVDQKNFVTKTTWCWMKLVRPLLTFFCYGWDCLLKKRETCSPSQNHSTLVWQSWFEIVWLVRNRKWVWSKQVNVGLTLLCNRRFWKKKTHKETNRKCSESANYQSGAGVTGFHWIHIWITKPSAALLFFNIMSSSVKGAKCSTVTVYGVFSGKTAWVRLLFPVHIWLMALCLVDRWDFC